MRLLKRLLQRLLILGLGIFSVWLIVFVVFEFCGPQAAVVSRAGRHVWNSGLYCPAARGPHGSEDPAAQVRAQLHDHRRRIARRSSQPCAPRDASTASCRLCNRRLVRGRSAGPGKFVAHDPGIRIQVTVSHRAIQYALPFRTRTRHRLPEGNRQQPTQAPPHTDSWASSLARVEDTWATANFWRNIDRPPDDACVLWVGAGTKDTGLSLTHLTFQITHATNLGCECRTGLHHRRVE